MQLVGLTALYVAAKFEEMFPPPVEDMVYISDNTYTREDVLSCEEDLLNTLEFNLCCTTEKNFLRRFQMAAAADIDAVKYLNFVVVLSNFLCERTLQEYEFVQFSHSVIAAGALALALHTLNLPAWVGGVQFCWVSVLVGVVLIGTLLCVVGATPPPPPDTRVV
jgi:Cyclin, N-terminal domain/Cyclin, C-terminal domain